MVCDKTVARHAHLTRDLMRGSAERTTISTTVNSLWAAAPLFRAGTARPVDGRASRTSRLMHSAFEESGVPELSGLTLALLPATDPSSGTPDGLDMVRPA